VARLSRGQIWTATYEGSRKPRPVLILSINAINDLCPDVLAIPITTKPGPLRVAFDHSESVTGLRKASYAKCETVGPLHKSRLKKKIGAVPLGELEPFENGVRRVLGLDH